MAEVLQDGVNLAVWQRQLPPQLHDFADVAARLGGSLTDQRVIEVDEHEVPVIGELLYEAVDIHGYDAFVADVTWLVSAYSYLLGARRVGLRIRALTSPMCPRFHVDNVPLRLITTYAGPGSEYLPDQDVARAALSTGDAAVDKVKRLNPGDVALFKGERWQGNEGAGVVHRSPSGPPRLLLTLDWLA
ncbi:DUF1826 domain-containing protein [Pseudomonas putida]|uniref:DUF1826 domain-containing protein n=1 Tax=Pseudomonas putida TaxID=303 RepID=UPI0035716B87